MRERLTLIRFAFEGQEPTRVARWISVGTAPHLLACAGTLGFAREDRRLRKTGSRCDLGEKARPCYQPPRPVGRGALNATDVNAVEEALRIKEAHGGEVVVVSFGPTRALESLRKALAMGADRAVLISDEAAAGSDLVATSYALAHGLGRESADLVLFGQQSSDSDGAVLWAAVADRLERPLISQVATLTVEDSSVTGKRQTEFGYDIITAPLPAVVAVSDAINEPRYPSLKGIMGAKSKPAETLSLEELGADANRVGEAGSRTSVVCVRAAARQG